MHKTTAVIAALCAVTLFAGCAKEIAQPDAPTAETIENVSAQDVGATKTDAATTEKDETTAAATTEKTPETEVIIRPTEQVTYSEEEGIPVANAYFSLKLPAEWDGHYLTATNYQGDVMVLRIREMASAEAGEDGTLFSLALAPDGSDYAVENGKELYQLADGTDRYTLYVVYPDGDPYTAKARQQYEAMQKQIASILRTLKPGEGFRFL